MAVAPEVSSPTFDSPTFDESGTPLYRVTFVVVDLETTGASPEQCDITEIGAAKYRGGECLGTLQTLVNPGLPIPPFIAGLTGITESMVLPAPMIREVLPPVLEFIGGAVIVGHNLRFDISFLDAALVQHGYAPLANDRVDTLAVARRLVLDEVENLKLGTLARHFRSATEPTHRALDDARATADLLHSLLERAAGFGVLGLDDLLAVPKFRAHRSTAKLGLTADLPRGPGIYLFRDRGGRLLEVGAAHHLRSQVRAYFTTEHRETVPPLLHQTTSIGHEEWPCIVDAETRAAELIRMHDPPFNRPAGTRKPRTTRRRRAA